jgi:multicomponent Na+:H+ antiporter subunit C
VTGYELFAAVGAALFALGVYGTVAQDHLVGRVVGFNVLGVGIFLFLISTARRNALDTGPDPVPHAMVLTGIVVAVSVTALALALARRLHAETGSASLDDGGDPSGPADG